MAAEFNRTERIAEAIQKTLTQILLQKITDPTLRFITFTAVKVSRDLSFADIQFKRLLLNKRR
ncbi:ribosome-binding factor A [Rickettsiella massiliensis]|uniref:ribosome-binding factor A n=1 Tax=Rickettsiella massiliensis TaxID=676517 RepID=UPI00029AABD3|nr:ribosome-binding factor A [Rickettsiella massiliensis]